MTNSLHYQQECLPLVNIANDAHSADKMMSNVKVMCSICEQQLFAF